MYISMSDLKALRPLSLSPINFYN